MASVTHLTNQSQFVQSNAVFYGTNATGTIASNGISVSVAAGGGGADGYNILAAGSQTANTTGTIRFVDSNGITFGMSNSSVITASHNGLTSQLNQAWSGSNASSTFQTLSFNNANGVSWSNNAGAVELTHGLQFTSNTSAITSNALHTSSPRINISAGTTSNNLSAFTISNSNGMSFGLNGSVITGSHNGLTTARASNDAVGLNTALTAGPLAWTVNSNGLSLNAGSAAGTTSGFGGNLISGSMTHNTAGLNLSLNHPAWLTTAMQSNAATISNINISAGTTSTNASAFTFGTGNGMSFGLGTGASAGIITASHNGLTSQSNQALSGSNGSFTFQTATFGNLNGLSFYTSNGSLVGSHNGLTTARASNDAVGLNTAQSNVTWTVNSSGISLDARGYAGTGSTFNGANISGSMTVNSVGVQLSMSVAAPGGGGGAAVSLPANGASRTSGGAGYSNITSGTAFFFGNNLTLSQDGASITVSANAPGAAAENNWIHALGNNTSGNTTASGSTIGFSGINLTISGTNNSVFNLSVPATSSMVGVSGISVSTNGSTISIIGGQTVSTLVNHLPYSTNSQTLGALGATSASARFFPISVSENVVFNVMKVMHNLSYQTSSVSGQQTISYSYGLFSNSGGTLSSISTGSFSLAVTNSSISNTVSYPVSTATGGYTYTTLGASSTATIQSYWGTAAGGRPIGLQFGNSMSLSKGLYWLGVLIRHSSSSANIGISMAVGGNANAMYNNLANIGEASSSFTTGFSRREPYIGLGAYTVSQSTLPNGVPITQIAHTQTVSPLVTFIST